MCKRLNRFLRLVTLFFFLGLGSPLAGLAGFTNLSDAYTAIGFDPAASSNKVVVMVSDVSPLSTLTQPSFGMPAIAATPSTFFSIPDVSLGTRELGSVVVVVGATVVVVVGAIVLIGAIAMVVVVGTTVVVVVVGATIVEVVVVVGAIVVEVVVVVGATVVVVGATVVEVVVVVGIVVSIISVRAELCSESLPALSVTTAVTAHVPSVRVANSHVVATAVS